MALVYFSGQVVLEGFVNLKIEAVRGQIFKGIGADVRGKSPLLGDGIPV